jgi:predicted glycosyltransferase
MARREPLRVVCYAVNGTGVGHVTRLLAIARWLRRYAAALDRKLEVWFLTSSEADGLVFAEGFASFKIPSKTIVAETGIDRRAYLALAKQWVWHTLGLLRPDLLVVDTFPRGSFGELLAALDLCRHKAFVYRPVRDAFAARPDFQAMLPLYDLLVVPEDDAPVLVPERARDRLVHVGPVLGRERFELLPRDLARAQLGVPSGGDARCVFVSAGGGGDRGVQEQLDTVVRGLTVDPRLHVVVGTGALYRGRPFPNVTVVPGRAAEWSLAFDAAVCAAGYNTYGELMFAGVPTAFLPQEKLADDQSARAARAVAAGAGLLLAREDDGASVLAAVTELLSRSEAPAAARALVPTNGARHAAAELLRLLVPPSDVDRVEDALDDASLARLHAAGTPERLALPVAHRLSHGDAGGLGLAMGRAATLLGGRDAHEAHELTLLVDAVTRGLPAASARQRADVCEAALGTLGALTQGDGQAARTEVAEGRWGGDGPNDGVALARGVRAARQGESSSSFLSTK